MCIITTLHRHIILRSSSLLLKSKQVQNWGPIFANLSNFLSSNAVSEYFKYVCFNIWWIKQSLEYKSFLQDMLDPRPCIFIFVLNSSTYLQVLLEEFGKFPVDRDAYFQNMYDAVLTSAKRGAPLKGAAFWQWYDDGQVRWISLISDNHSSLILAINCNLKLIHFWPYPFTTLPSHIVLCSNLDHLCFASC